MHFNPSFMKDSDFKNYISYSPKFELSSYISCKVTVSRVAMNIESYVFYILLQ